MSCSASATSSVKIEPRSVLDGGRAHGVVGLAAEFDDGQHQPLAVGGRPAPGELLQLLCRFERRSRYDLR